MTTEFKTIVIAYLHQKSLITIYRNGYTIEQQCDIDFLSFIKFGIEKLSKDLGNKLPNDASFYSSLEFIELESKLNYFVNGWMLDVSRYSTVKSLRETTLSKFRLSLCPGFYPFC